MLPQRAGLTVIMACRNATRAKNAQTKLRTLLDKHIATLQSGSEERQHAITFRSNLKLELEILNLSSMQSVLDFGRNVAKK